MYGLDTPLAREIRNMFPLKVTLSLQQQNPPRFPFEQRTRAGLLLFMGTIRLYTKQALSISEQIELLKNRGLNIADNSKAEKFLGEVSYFRFFIVCAYKWHV